MINQDTKAPIAGARVELYDTFENKLSTMTTDANGGATFKAECDKEHIIQGVAKDYESNAVNVESGNDTNLTSTLALRPIDAIIVDDQVELNPILFDYDKSNIKPQAAFELDKLVAIMKKYPSMVIKVESHTDNRASDSYNMNLSERRAQSTVQYVISKGIDRNRISGSGFGESRPAIACGNGCTEAQHQQNRRSEFIIVKR